MHCFQRAGNGEPLGPPMSVLVPMHALLCLGLAAPSEPPPTHRQLSPMQISSSVSASPMQRNLNSLRESANLRLADDRSVRGEMQTSAWERAAAQPGTGSHQPPWEGYTKGPPCRAGTRGEGPRLRTAPESKPCCSTALVTGTAAENECFTSHRLSPRAESY